MLKKVEKKDVIPNLDRLQNCSDHETLLGTFLGMRKLFNLMAKSTLGAKPLMESGKLSVIWAPTTGDWLRKKLKGEEWLTPAKKAIIRRYEQRTGWNVVAPGNLLDTDPTKVYVTLPPLTTMREVIGKAIILEIPLPETYNHVMFPVLEMEVGFKENFLFNPM